MFKQWVDLFDLTLEFGNANPLQTDYNTQVTEFAIGNAAMTQQGNWTQVAISQTNPDINIGFLPMPINNDADAMDKLPVGVPSNWVVHKNSPVKEEAKAFLNWMVTFRNRPALHHGRVQIHPGIHEHPGGRIGAGAAGGGHHPLQPGRQDDELELVQVPGRRSVQQQVRGRHARRTSADKSTKIKCSSVCSKHGMK